MRPDKELEQALAPVGLPVKYYEYEGSKDQYIVYNEEAENAVNYADNQPQNSVIWWQVHLFAPKGSDFRGYKDAIKRNLIAAGYSITDTRTLYEKETKTIHVAISCHTEEREE